MGSPGEFCFRLHPFLIDVYLIAYFVSNNIPGRIEAAACPNQDPLKATTGLVPLLGIDVW